MRITDMRITHIWEGAHDDVRVRVEQGSIRFQTQRSVYVNDALAATATYTFEPNSLRGTSESPQGIVEVVATFPRSALSPQECKVRYGDRPLRMHHVTSPWFDSRPKWQQALFIFVGTLIAMLCVATWSWWELFGVWGAMMIAAQRVTVNYPRPTE